MESALEAIAQIVRDLRVFARSDEDEQPQIVHLPDLLDQVIRIVGREVTTRGNLERDYAPDLPVLALPRARVAQVIANVLVNAAHALDEIRRPVHRVRISARADTEAVAISIADTGPGIAPEALDRIFDPFFTTKADRNGTGLGLSISRSILRRIGGDLIVESVHGVGATFVALIPLTDPASLREAYQRTSKVRQAPVVSAARSSILVVDDDDRILRSYPRILQGRFDVIAAADGQEAIDLLASGSNPDVILTDLAMPGVDGRELYAWLVENRPELARRTIFVTGGPTTERHAEFLSRVKNPVYEKPIRAEALVAVILETLSRR